MGRCASSAAERRQALMLCARAKDSDRYNFANWHDGPRPVIPGLAPANVAT